LTGRSQCKRGYTHAPIENVDLLLQKSSINWISKTEKLLKDPENYISARLLCKGDKSIPQESDQGLKRVAHGVAKAMQTHFLGYWKLQRFGKVKYRIVIMSW